ncbi:fasciclin domain-containing protein [Mucilaginibacter pedocola]|uniref:Fasciclin n=1 Tax=Mucilaginibacter pedocola TaxID=1792845 RepID=A0A1S9PDH3_9SPHI|nr:fasciclin domain-containing protein [Mucilaginibacter pedocola]OOQ59026.1 fasciclin [Mucilaginibacter pedocola]
MKNLFTGVFAMAVMAIPPSAVAQTQTMGGATMYTTKNIVANAGKSKEHTTFAHAIKAAGLGSTLQSAGPFTVFAPTDEAFDKLPAGTMDMLVKPENKAPLTKLLTYHVVGGILTADGLLAKIKAGNGKAELATVSGGNLIATADGKRIYLLDERGNKARITLADIAQSNGVIHVVDMVLVPN